MTDQTQAPLARDLGFIRSRLAENSTRTALAAIFAAALAYLGGQIDLAGMIAAMLAAGIAIVTPNNAKAALLAGFLALGLAGCTPAQLDQVRVGCLVDGQFQPLASAIASQVPQAAPGVAVDQALVHPAVMAFCAGMGGAPAAR